MFTNRILCLLCGYAEHIKDWTPGPESWAPLEFLLAQEKAELDDKAATDIPNKEWRDALVRRGIEIGNAPFLAHNMKPAYNPADPGFG